MGVYTWFEEVALSCWSWKERVLDDAIKLPYLALHDCFQAGERELDGDHSPFDAKYIRTLMMRLKVV